VRKARIRELKDISMEHMRGETITTKSFEIIRERLGRLDVTDEELEIIIRIAHTTGDVEFAKTFLFSPGSIRLGVDALAGGANVITDVEMVRTGIRARLLEALGGRVLCFLNDPEVVEESRTAQSTRSALGMRKAAEAMAGGVVAVGNAPTALFELMEMVQSGAARPALIVGVPVGFVGALESKQDLSALDWAHITNLSERGGSTIAAAIVNGLLALAERRMGPHG
jgi:precorrin-8X/cobalt-precorrin-8 methylmutase